jgi:hypothetical protein
MRRTLRLSALAITGALALAACGGSGDDSPAVTPAAQASSTVTAAPTTTAATGATAATTTVAAGATTTTAGAATVAKVNANTASQSDIAAAITAAGVSNGARWAVEVVEYRPYPTNDPTFAKLRQNLAKYNPGPGVVDGIISALSL